MSNVISIATGLPIEEEAVLIEEALVEEEARQTKVAAMENVEIIQRLDAARNLAMAGRMQGLMVISTDPVTGLFYTDVNLKALPREELFSYMGVLQTLICEIQEHASMAPCIDGTGNIIDPYSDAQEA